MMFSIDFKAGKFVPMREITREGNSTLHILTYRQSTNKLLLRNYLYRVCLLEETEIIFCCLKGQKNSSSWNTHPFFLSLGPPSVFYLLWFCSPSFRLTRLRCVIPFVNIEERILIQNINALKIKQLWKASPSMKKNNKNVFSRSSESTKAPCPSHVKTPHWRADTVPASLWTPPGLFIWISFSAEGGPFSFF